MERVDPFKLVSMGFQKILRALEDGSAWRQAQAEDLERTHLAQSTEQTEMFPKRPAPAKPMVAKRSLARRQTTRAKQERTRHHGNHLESTSWIEHSIPNGDLD